MPVTEQYGRLHLTNQTIARSTQKCTSRGLQLNELSRKSQDRPCTSRFERVLLCIKFEITINLKVFYLHFDCKIDVLVNNPIGSIHILTISCQMTFVHAAK
jgi:hypothetical protein